MSEVNHSFDSIYQKTLIGTKFGQIQKLTFVASAIKLVKSVQGFVSILFRPNYYLKMNQWSRKTFEINNKVKLSFQFPTAKLQTSFTI